ncbi:MAG: ABC transporter ATP-binding protein/permease, partial [Gammaproteobacteria bacterium]|nr:ABC transporter ATP-binding protein/permease [Gammaproteobacteria bacterium]
LVLLAAIVVMNQALHWMTTVAANGLGLRFVGRVRNAAMMNLLAISFPGAERFNKGDLLARLSHDINNVQHLMVETPLFLWSHLLTLTVYSAMLWWLHSPLALLAMALTPLFLFHQALFNPFKRRFAQAFLTYHGRLLGVEDQSIEDLRGISTFNAEAQRAQQHRDAYEIARAWAMKERRLDAAFTATFSLVIYGSGLAILFAGLHAVEAQTLAIGALLSFLLYLGYMSVPVRGFVQLSFQAQADAAGAARVWEIMSAPAMVADEGDGAIENIRGAIWLEDVHFGYAETPIFSHASVQIPAGSTVAVVGPSGAGKSTLAKLLLRFYDPQRGRILLDGVDIRDIPLKVLRQYVTVVWQQPLLFDGSLRDNLLLSRPGASDAELIAVCQDAYAWEFVAQWPLQLNTVIGTGGVELSAGQSQRIAIAQGLLRNAPVLVLDEPSSALDSESERKVVQALARLRRGRTTFIIAHRYSSVRSADSVIYLNGDGSTQHATHEELLHTHPGYRDAVQWQLQSPAITATTA